MFPLFTQNISVKAFLSFASSSKLTATEFSEHKKILFSLYQILVEKKPTIKDPHFHHPQRPLTPIYIVCINVTTFLLYGWDKVPAIYGWWRIMEFTLHTLSFLGGWPAAFLAQHLFNHKTRKSGFRVIFWLIVVIHVVAILFLMNQV